MTSITVYDGANTIGGNKIYIEDKGKGIFLDFGMNFKKYGKYFQDFLKERSVRGIHDLIHLNLIPKLNIYRNDLNPSDLDLSPFPSLNIEAVLLSHAHMDHYGNIGLLDQNIPVIASPTSIALLKGILDSTKQSLNTEVAYFSKKISADDNRTLKSDRKDYIGRDFICTEDYSNTFKDFLFSNIKASPRTKTEIEHGNLRDLGSQPTQFDIKAFEVDHSIYGSTGYIISGETTIAYTGDFRLHGKRANDSKKFVNAAKGASILIIEGTRAKREKDISESEDIVLNNCLKAAEEAKGIVIANFSGRNIERLEIFQNIANQTKREIVITAKIAYLLKSLEQVDGINRLKNLLIFDELKTQKRYWEENFLKGDETIAANYIDSIDIAKEPKNYLLCLGFYDMKHLLDIKPEKGTYIYSSSEAFDEESELDFVRFNNWLKHFSFIIYGFEIIKDKGRLKPTFQKGFHASGHVSKKDIQWTIETIDPDVIIPVHTDDPTWFNNFDKVVLLKDGQTHRI